MLIVLYYLAVFIGSLILAYICILFASITIKATLILLHKTYFFLVLTHRFPAVVKTNKFKVICSIWTWRNFYTYGFSSEHDCSYITVKLSSELPLAQWNSNFEMYIPKNPAGELWN